jgi:hypothetical protein
MLSQIIDSYKNNLPEKFPQGAVKTFAGTVALCALRGDTEQKTSEKIVQGFSSMLVHNLVSVPLSKYVFSDITHDGQEIASFVISACVGQLSCYYFSRGSTEVSFSGLVAVSLVFIFREPNEAYPFVV